MAIDAVFPAASELVMVYAGALASGAFPSQHVVLFGHQIDSGGWAFVTMALAGTRGYLAGAIVGWWIGRRGGRPFVERHGRVLHLGPDRLARAERWFDRHDRWAVLAVPVADGDRLGDLGVRARRDRVCLRQQLRTVPPCVRPRTRCRSCADR